MVKEPRIIPRIAEIVPMDGAMTHGNATPAAEFNICVDPHATRAVLGAGVRLTMGATLVGWWGAPSHQAMATVIDDIAANGSTPSVAAALTARYWEDRLLGKSETTRLPIRCVWIATGNTPQFSNELVRRLVCIRLGTHVDQFWRQDGFRHSSLLAGVRVNRTRLLDVCLTLGRD